MNMQVKNEALAARLATNKAICLAAAPFKTCRYHSAIRSIPSGWVLGMHEYRQGMRLVFMGARRESTDHGRSAANEILHGRYGGRDDISGQFLGREKAQFQAFGTALQ